LDSLTFSTLLGWRPSTLNPETVVCDTLPALQPVINQQKR
jgi:hypothetical protein